MEPASLMISTPSGDEYELLGTGRNRGVSIASGWISHEVAPATAGTEACLIPEMKTLGTGGGGPGGGVGQGARAEIDPAFESNTNTTERAIPMITRERHLIHPRAMSGVPILQDNRGAFGYGINYCRHQASILGKLLCGQCREWFSQGVSILCNSETNSVRGELVEP